MTGTSKDIFLISRIIGGDFTNAATRAMVFNGIDVTYASSGTPYSFNWKGLRIDSSSKVKYFYRFGQDTTKYFKEFTGLFGLQASQEESDIFENNFKVQSVATVKGLKLVSANTFSGITLHKITSANESDIDTLSVSTNAKSVFHTAVQAGKIIYTPSAPVTYGTWQGLFYINIDFKGGAAGYIIGEGLNGGFSACALPGITSICNWNSNDIDLLVNQAMTTGGTITASLTDLFKIDTAYGAGSATTSLMNQSSPTVIRGQSIGAVFSYVLHLPGKVITWTKNFVLSLTQLGTVKITAQHDSTVSKTVTVVDGSHPTSVVCASSLEGRSLPATSGKIGEEMHLPLSIDKASGIYLHRHGISPNENKQYNVQDTIWTHGEAPEFRVNYPTSSPALTTNNVNDPWIDPATGKYWNMSVGYGAFFKPAASTDHEKYYMNMRWLYTELPLPQIEDEKKWYFGKRVWIKNPSTHKAILAGILDYGPADNLQHPRVAGASPEAMQAIGAHTDDSLQYCWATDQTIPYGYTIGF